jgi:hypothetical protein
MEAAPPRAPAIRTIEDADVDRVARLLEETFGTWPRVPVAVDGASHLRWKRSSRPEGNAGSLLAEVDRELAGTIAWWAQLAVVDGVPVLMATGYDAAVHPAHQGRDVYETLRRARVQEMKAPFGLHVGHSGNAALNTVRGRLGATSIANRPLVLEWRPGGLDLRVRAGRALVVRASRFRSPRRFRGPVGPLDGFGEATDLLFQRTAAEFRFIVGRAADRMRWRYCDGRGGRSVLRQAIDGGRLAGYAVLRFGREHAYLADLLVAPGRADVVRALAADAIGVARGEGFASLRAWLPGHHPYRRPLAAEGLLPTGHEVDLRYTPMSLPAAALGFFADPRASIHYVMGDSDIV